MAGLSEDDRKLAIKQFLEALYNCINDLQPERSDQNADYMTDNQLFTAEFVPFSESLKSSYELVVNTINRAENKIGGMKLICEVANIFPVYVTGNVKDLLQEFQSALFWARQECLDAIKYRRQVGKSLRDNLQKAKEALHAIEQLSRAHLQH